MRVLAATWGIMYQGQVRDTIGQIMHDSLAEHVSRNTDVAIT